MSTWAAGATVLLLAGVLGCGRPNATSPPKASAGILVGQSSPGLRVKIDSIALHEYSLPQVRLADTAAARRINQALVLLLLGEHDDLGPDLLKLTTEPRQALRRTWAAAYTDPDTGQSQPGRGLTGCGYTVRYNDGWLLSFELFLETTGAYSSTSFCHAVFDVRTGQQLTVKQVLTDTTRLQQRLRKSINERTAETLADVAEEGDTALVNDLARFFHWNPTIRQVDFTETDSTNLPSIYDFLVTSEGITVFSTPYVPHPIANYTPEAAYVFPFNSVRLRPEWQYLLKVPRPAAAESEH